MKQVSSCTRPACSKCPNRDAFWSKCFLTLLPQVSSFNLSSSTLCLRNVWENSGSSSERNAIYRDKREMPFFNQIRIFQVGLNRTIRGMNLPYHHFYDGLVELRQRYARRRRDSLVVQVCSFDHECGPRV